MQYWDHSTFVYNKNSLTYAFGITITYFLREEFHCRFCKVVSFGQVHFRSVAVLKIRLAKQNYMFEARNFAPTSAKLKCRIIPIRFRLLCCAKQVYLSLKWLITNNQLEMGLQSIGIKQLQFLFHRTLNDKFFQNSPNIVPVFCNVPRSKKLLRK